MDFCKGEAVHEEGSIFPAPAHIHASDQEYGMICVAQEMLTVSKDEALAVLLGVARHEVCHLVGERPSEGSGHGPRWLKALQSVSIVQKARCPHRVMEVDCRVLGESRYCGYCGTAEAVIPSLSQQGVI
jgi:hypothetical protein